MIRRHLLPLIAGVVAVFSAAGASRNEQPERIPIRTVSAPTATTPQPFAPVAALREIGGGRILIDIPGEQRLVLLDSTLSTARTLADASGVAEPYSRLARIVPHLGDSTLFLEPDFRSFVLLDPDGKISRVLALPRASEWNAIASSSVLGVDSKGRLVYESFRPRPQPGDCKVVDGQAVRPVPSNIPLDTVVLLRADFETRSVDSIARVQVVAPGLQTPVAETDLNCKLISAKMLVNPSVPPTDVWTITADGTVAIVRSHDYHVDWIGGGGKMTTTPKMPFDWRRISDTDKQRRIDSARVIIDSVSKVGGYHLMGCGNQRMFIVGSYALSRDANAPRGRGGSAGGAGEAPVSVGRGGNSGGLGVGALVEAPSCEWATVPVVPEFVSLDKMPDYVPPLREKAALADRDGNVWILPATSSGAGGGLLYDVVNAKGVLVERVQLPPDRTIVGFGRNGVVFLSRGVGETRSVLERVLVVRR